MTLLSPQVQAQAVLALRGPEPAAAREPVLAGSPAVLEALALLTSAGSTGNHRAIALDGSAADRRTRHRRQGRRRPAPRTCEPGDRVPSRSSRPSALRWRAEWWPPAPPTARAPQTARTAQRQVWELSPRAR